MDEEQIGLVKSSVCEPKWDNKEPIQYFYENEHT